LTAHLDVDVNKKNRFLMVHTFDNGSSTFDIYGPVS